MFSDLGPWKDPQWVKPAKWETLKTAESKETKDEAINATTTSSGVPGETKDASKGAPVEIATDPAKDKVPAPGTA